MGYSYIVPINYGEPGAPISVDRQMELVAETRRAASERLVNTAIRLGIRVDPYLLDVRALDPQRDLQLRGRGWYTGALIPDGPHQFIKTRLPNDICIIIYGFFYDSAPPSISNVIMAEGVEGAQVRGLYHLEPMFSLPASFALLTEAVMYIRGELVHISLEAHRASPMEHFGLVGLTCEPLGRTIAEPGSRGELDNAGH